jgi:protein O-mannosyl-transferase
MGMNSKSNRLYAFIITSIAIAVYLPGLSGGFIFDDYVNFLQNPKIHDSELSLVDAWAASQSSVSGPLGRPISMLSFYFNFHIGSFSPISYKIINIAIHALNALLVFIIVSRILHYCSNRFPTLEIYSNKNKLALWIALLWAIHPINLTAVLYVVQRMTSLAAMFTLVGIYFYINLRESDDDSLKKLILGLCLVTLSGVLSALCKENGLLLFLFLFLIECFIFQWKTNTVKQTQLIKTYYILVLALPLSITGLMILTGLYNLDYSDKAFDLTQRVLTEFRVLWFYILQILLPQAHLFGLYHDDFVLSTSLINPATTIISIVSFIVLAILSVKYIKKFPWFAFGYAFFIAGHAMESTILPLIIVQEHRNYIPSIGLLIILVFSLHLLLQRVRFLNKNLIFLAVISIVGLNTINRSYDWGDILLLGERLAQRHPNSVTSHYQMGQLYMTVYVQTNNTLFSDIAKTALQRADNLSHENMESAITLVHMMSMVDDPENQALIKKINTDFKTGDVTVTEIKALRQLLNCINYDYCKLSIQTLDSFFSSLLDNHKLQGRLKDDVLYFYASYLVNIPGMEPIALKVMEDIVSRNPELLEYKIQLLSVLMSNDRHDEANELMDKLSKEYGMTWDFVNDSNPVD